MIRTDRQVDLVVDKETATPEGPVLEVADLTVLDERSHLAVDDVSFSVVEGGTLVGQSGSTPRTSRA